MTSSAFNPQRTIIIGTVILFGYGFLYFPIAVLILYSFNASKLVTVWGGFSLHWYQELFANQLMMNAAWLSIRIAFINACLAVALGALAAFCLARYKRLRGRGFLTLLLTTPLVIPDIILGLALLLFFVSLQQFLGWPANRGISTITIAHTTFSTAYVAVLVYANLIKQNTDLEAAAQDLGATPWQCFIYITLPLTWPALLAGWLLAFTLSLDDLVIASFVSGPGATTLPMYIYSGVRLGVTPAINAMATLLIGFVILSLLAASWLLKQRT